MAASNRNKGRKVYYLVPDDGMMSLEQQWEDNNTRQGSESLGPLGEGMPSQEPELRPGYSPRKGGHRPTATPRGFFLDRYVY